MDQLHSDGCCPAWAGNELTGDADCLLWDRSVSESSAAYLAAVPTTVSGDTRLVATLLSSPGPGRPNSVTVLAFDADGERTWEQPLDESSHIVPPVVCGGAGILVCAGGQLRLLNLASGLPEAAAPLDVAVAPLVLPDGRTLVVDTGTGAAGASVSLLGNDLGEQEILDASVAGTVTRAAPTLGSTGSDGAPDRVYVVSDAGVVSALSLDTAHTAPLWTYDLDGHVPAVHAPARFGAHLMVLTDDGYLVVLRDEGERVTATPAQSLGASPAPGLVVDGDGRVYVATRSGRVALFEITEQGVSQTAVLDVGRDVARAAPLLHPDGTLFLGGAQGFVGLRAGVEPALQWRLDTPAEGALTGNLVVLSGLGVVGVQTSGRITAIRPGDGALADAPWPCYRGQPNNAGAL